MEHLPSAGSCSEAEAEDFVDLLTAILDKEVARVGVINMMDNPDRDVYFEIRGVDEDGHVIVIAC